MNGEPTNTIRCERAKEEIVVRSRLPAEPLNSYLVRRFSGAAVAHCSWPGRVEGMRVIRRFADLPTSER